MSTTVIRKEYRVNNILTDPTSAKLSDKTDTYGVRRADTLAVVVADDTTMTKVSTGIYEYAFTDPAPDLTYEYVFEVVYLGSTSYYQGTIAGGATGTENLYSLLPLLAPYLEDCPEPIQKAALRDMFRDMTRKTGVWIEDLATISTVEDQAEYALNSSFDAEILRVLEVKLDGSDSAESINSYTISEDTNLVFDLAPTVAGEDIDVKVALYADSSCDSVPAWVLTRYSQSIVDGALYKLKSMSTKPWASASEAQFYMNQYLTSLGMNKVDKTKDRQPAQLRIRPGRVF